MLPLKRQLEKLSLNAMGTRRSRCGAAKTTKRRPGAYVQRGWVVRLGGWVVRWFGWVVRLGGSVVRLGGSVVGWFGGSVGWFG